MLLIPFWRAHSRPSLCTDPNPGPGRAPGTQKNSPHSQGAQTNRSESPTSNKLQPKSGADRCVTGAKTEEDDESDGDRGPQETLGIPAEPLASEGDFK